MQLIVIDNSYPSSCLIFSLVYDDDGYPWEGTPYIALNEQQLLHLATRFDISLAKAKEVIIAHELGQFSLYLKEYCLRTYSIS